MHQGIGLEAFNELPERKALHALYECVNSVPFAADIARGRPYRDHDQLFRRADSLLFNLPEDTIDTIVQAYPHVGRRPGSAKSQAEQCSVWDHRCDVMAGLDSAAQRYAEQFGFGFVMLVDNVNAEDLAEVVLATITDRMHNDAETERKVVRNELGKINRTRLERMLGPEGGYSNW